MIFNCERNVLLTQIHYIRTIVGAEKGEISSRLVGEQEGL